MKIKLEHKNLSYSLLLAGCLLLFLISYFICMLPSLYVDHLMDENLKAIREQHRMFVNTGSYENARVKNPTACFSLRIPDQGDTVFLAGKTFSFQLTFTDDRLKELLHRCQASLQDFHRNPQDTDNEYSIQTEQIFEDWTAVFRESFSDSVQLPIEIKSLQLNQADTLYTNEYFRYHPISDQMFILETGVEDTNNSYINYIAMEKLEDSLVLSFLPVMTPDINEIRPVILQSLPFLAATVLLAVLIFSRIYSKGIVAPAQLLIRQSYEELQQKNQKLEEENIRQEVFLRASSHQLKTPVSAALLLTDSMIGKVGKYADRDLYLPGVKEHLLSMRKIIDDILYLNRLKDQIQIQEIDLDALLDSCLLSYRIIGKSRQLSLICDQGAAKKVFTDERIASLILDNLLSNAVNYTPSGGRIEIRTSPGTIRIQNYGTRIPPDLLPHIFDPFVSGNHGSGGHGLGLYLASYYAPMAGAFLSVTNEGESVLAILCFHRHEI